jgi:hypothetical protein
MKKITKDDIMVIGQYNAIVYTALSLNYRGELTFDEAMMFAVSVLVRQVEELRVRLEKSITNSSNPSWKLE